MADYIPTLSLKSIQFAPNTFTPVSYTPIETDGSLLAKSLQQQEARDVASNSELSKIAQTLVSTRALLNDAELDWFDQYSDDIQNRIKAEVDAGNFQSAIKFAQQEAYNLANNRDLQNKIAVNAAYQKELQQVESNARLDDATKRRWKALNQYNYTGGRTWKESWTPLDDIDISNLQRLAVAMTAEDAQSTFWQTSKGTPELVDVDGNVTTDISKAVGINSKTSTGRGGGESTHIKTKEDITKTFKSLLADTNVKRKLMQKYDTSFWDYEDCLARSKDMNLSETERNQASLDAIRLKQELTNEDGILIKDYDTWVEKKVISMFENTEYYNSARSSSKSDDMSYSDSRFKANLTKYTNDATKVIEETEVGVRGTQVQDKFAIPTIAFELESTEDANDYVGLF